MDETDQALAAFGLVQQGGQNEYLVWPEHETAVGVFASVLTQWRIAPMGGVIGLDYGVLPPVLELLAVPREQWTEVFEAVRVMENEAIKVMNT